MVKTKSNTYVQLVRSYREGQKTKHELLCSLGTLEDLKQNKTFVQLAKRLLSIAEHTTPYPETVSALPVNQSKTSNSRESAELEGTPVNWGYLVYETLWKQLELDSILQQIVSQSKIQFDLNQSCFLMCLEHLLAPKSKQGTYDNQSRYLHFSPLKLHHLYRTLDALPAQKETVEQHLFLMNQGLFNQKVDVVFFDATTFSFASTLSDDLRQFGYSKDGKGGEVQVVFGLLMDKEGRPIGYELFPGNTFDGHTLVPFLDALKSRFAIDQIILVADRGLNNGENLQSIKDHGYDYIVGTRLRHANSAIQRKVFQEEGYIERYISSDSTITTTSDQDITISSILKEMEMNREEASNDPVEEDANHNDDHHAKKEELPSILATDQSAVTKLPFPDLGTASSSLSTTKKPNHTWVYDTSYEKNRRLILSWNRKRALHDQKNREKLVQSILRKLERASKQEQEAEQQTQALEQDSTPTKKTKRIKAKSKRLILQAAMRKYVKLLGKDATYEINEEAIESEQRWDGFKGVITNDHALDPLPLLSFYHSLWKVEDSFRLNKHDLSIRPVYVWTKKRIHAHIGICYLAFAIARVLENTGWRFSKERGCPFARCGMPCSRLPLP